MRPDDHRRKWDRKEYERLAQERLLDSTKSTTEDGKDRTVPFVLYNWILIPHFSEEPITKELLKQREYKVDLDSKLGKSMVINKSTPSSQSGGYYCNVCDCVVKDSINFLDHINGKKHQRNLGMSMKVERSSLDQVKERFKVNKKKTEEKKKDYELESRVKEAKEEEERYREYKREKRKERKRKIEEVDDADAGPSELAAVMGFAGFGGSKK